MVLKYEGWCRKEIDRLLFKYTDDELIQLEKALNEAIEGELADVEAYEKEKELYGEPHWYRKMPVR